MATAKKKPAKKAASKDKTQKSPLTQKQRDFLTSLRENLGIVSKSADEHNMHRNTHYKWMKENPHYAEEVKAIFEDCLDVVENALFNNILQGDNASIIFYLKTKGKSRGFVEKQEVGYVDKAGNDVEPPKQQVIIINGKEVTF
jgi:uncharacterized Zn ribbon protein